MIATAPFGILFRYFGLRYIGWLMISIVGLTSTVTLIQAIELARRAHPTITGIQTQHDFPQCNHIVPTLVGGLDIKNGHRLRRV